MEIKSITSADSGRLYRLWVDLLGSRWPVSEATLSTAFGIKNDDDNRLSLGLWQGQTLCGIAFAEVSGASR